MKTKRQNYFHTLALAQKSAVLNIFKRHPFAQGGVLEYLLQKYFWHFIIIFILIVLSLVSKFLPLVFKPDKPAVSLDHLVPKGFVLVPIEISNGKDITGIIGQYGVVDLYSYSNKTGLPDKQAASALKILPPKTEEGHFLALVPEKQASDLFQYSDLFYAVIQNPGKKSSKIYKKRKSKSLIVIEEDF